MTGKWENVDAGPRQVKELNRAIGALTSEGQSHDELYGVTGADEHRSTVLSMMGPVRSEVTVLDEAIRGKYGYRVTRATVRQIIADYEAATLEAAKSRPVEDNRRTPEADAELKTKVAAQLAAWHAEQDAAAAVLATVMAKAPRGAKALIYAEYHVDTSDPVTDYFSSRTTRTVAIGFRHSSREDFRALRAAAARFAETADVEFTEHRDNWSMGSGNYLSDHGSASSGSGWVVRSRAFPCAHVGLTEDAIPDTPASGGNGFYDQRGNGVPQRDATGAVTVSPSSIGREGVVEVRFAEKPAPDVLASLKAHGFRWARRNCCWYGTDIAFAESLATSAADLASTPS